jgi:hypothetical protein
MSPDQDRSHSESVTETKDPPREARVALDARDVLTRVLYEALSGRVSDDLQWALG